MDFTLSVDQALIKETVRRFMQRECPRETAHALDEQGAFPVELMQRIAELGFCGLNVPEKFGGGGQDTLATAIVIEEIAALSPALAELYAGVSLIGGWVLTRFGSPWQQREFLPQIAQGALKFTLACHDVQAEDGPQVDPIPAGFLLSGRAPSVNLAERADYMIVPARSRTEADRQTVFLVPARQPGVQLETIQTVGQRGLGVARVSFDSVRLAPEQVLGGAELAGHGQTQLESLIALVRLAGAAVGLGLAQSAYAYTLNYTRQRSQFGHPILEFEAVEHMLVDLAAGLQSTRWLLYHACWLADQGRPFSLEAAFARLQAGSLARQAGLHSVQLLGGYGYMAEYDAQRYLRDSLVLFSGAEPSRLLKNSTAMYLHSL
jgi:alkylation response protein AidB-like acyl-CoA dehydrogenase